LDHLNAGQRGMAAAMVYPEAKHGGDASAPAVDYPIADVVAITFDTVPLVRVQSCQSWSPRPQFGR